MTPKKMKPGMGWLFLRLTIVSAILVGILSPSSRGFAEDYISEFEGPETSWNVFLPPQDSRVTIHQRRRGIGRVGGAEFIRIKSTRENSPVRFEHALPLATVLDELEVAVWVKSSRDGFTLELKLILPEVLDPETNAPLSLLIAGDKYQTPDQWQQLKCRTSDRAISDKLRLLRAQNKMTINPKVMYVERVVLNGQLPPGATDLTFDDLTLTPYVQFESREQTRTLDSKRTVVQVRDEMGATDSRSTLPVKFDLHRLTVEGKSFFPRVINYHQERPEVLSQAGINVAWVRDYEDTNVTGPLRRQGLWITAAPPYAKGTDGEPLDSDDASLLPFQANTSPVLFWMLGARMTLDGRPRVTSWTNQIRTADRRFNKRPIAADVIENERLFSRHVDLLGISRHVIHSNFSIADYRDWIIQRRDQAWPDTFCWTWIQTEPAPTLAELSLGIESPPMLEPEQIRLQVYAALAAGCRGLGYWTTTPLDHDSPAAKERRLILKQLSLELDLFEPWITSGGVPQLVSFKVEVPRNEPLKDASKAAKVDPPKASRYAQPTVRRNERELHAAMIRSEQGLLVLPMWLEDSAQFVPGSMVANNVTIIVPGGGDTAAAWEITTTGQLRNLDREPAAGGVQIKLPKFDQTAAILITGKHSVVEELNQKILTIQEDSSKISVELAKLKLERVRQVDQTLQTLGVAKNNSWQWLGDAKIQLDKADAALRAQQPAEARQHASEAMQLGRFLQRAHWENAVRRMPSPTTNPWAVSFQSLPEFWRMTRRIENVDALETRENLLPSGEFEDRDTLVAEHWKHEQSMLDAVESSAELYPVAKQGEFSLRLSARPINGEAIPGFCSTPPVMMASPGIGIRAGQIVRITGWVKIPTTLVGSLDGALIYDNLLGKSGAVRLKAAQDWQRFELLRPVTESTDVTVSISLNGLGELFVDDLRITAFETGPDAVVPVSNKSSISPPKRSSLDIRRFNPVNPMRR